MKFCFMKLKTLIVVFEKNNQVHMPKANKNITKNLTFVLTIYKQSKKEILSNSIILPLNRSNLFCLFVMNLSLM